MRNYWGCLISLLLSLTGLTSPSFAGQSMGQDNTTNTGGWNITSQSSDNTSVSRFEQPRIAVDDNISVNRFVTPPPAYNNLPDNFICQRIAHQVELEQGIPPQLLAAISLTETGRSTRVIEGQPKIFSTWPWSINVEGKGYTFKSKEEAIEKVRSFQAMGKRSIDVGCMQVNLKFHPKAFDSLEEAFDPTMNVLYAASFVKSLSNRHGGWKEAIERYHSGTPKYYNVYREIVFKNWNRERKRHSILAEYKANQANQILDQHRLDRLKQVAQEQAFQASPVLASSSSSAHTGQWVSP